jgi:hypothetical protein
MKTHGQITIFVIVAISLIVISLLFILFKTDISSSEIGTGQDLNVNSFLQQCMEEKVEKTINTLMAQGGYIENQLHIEFEFEGEPFTNISYLCYNEESYLPCINQEPVLMKHLKDEIHTEINQEVENCFKYFIDNLKKSGKTSKSKYNGFEIQIVPEKIIIIMAAEIKIEKAGESISQSKMGMIYPTKFHELASIVREIVGQEAQYCSFEHIGYALLYPEFNIDRFRTSSLSTIYTVENKQSKERFRFAIKSCTIPPGLTE